MWLEVIQACKNSLVDRLARSRRKSEHDVKVEMNTVFKASPSARTISTNDGAALLDFGAGVCCSLNQVGDTIWQQISSSTSGVTVEAILQHLELTFKVSQEEIQEETIAYLQNLKQQGFVCCNRNRKDPAPQSEQSS